MTRRLLLLLCAIPAMLAVAISASGAQTYPDRPVRLIVPFTAGTPLDIIARIIAPKLSDGLKQQVYIENVPGAGNIKGITTAAEAAADGYTLLMIGQSASSITPFVYGKPPYSIEEQFRPIHLSVTYPFVLAVNKDVPAANIEEFVKFVKGSSEAVRYGTTGPAAGSNLVTVRLSNALGLKMRAVQYKGGGDITTALIRGDVHLYTGVPESFVAHSNGGGIRVLATLGETRHPSFPETPTMIESGVQFTATSWYGMVAPKGVSDEIAQLLNTRINAVMKDKEVRERFVKLGLTPVESTIEEFANLMKEERDSWGPIISAAGIKVD